MGKTISINNPSRELMGAIRDNAVKRTTEKRTPDEHRFSELKYVELGTEFVIGKQFFHVIRVLDEPNSGLVVIHNEPSGHEFTIPAVIIEGLLRLRDEYRDLNAFAHSQDN